MRYGLTEVSTNPSPKLKYVRLGTVENNSICAVGCSKEHPTA